MAYVSSGTRIMRVWRSGDGGERDAGSKTEADAKLFGRTGQTVFKQGTWPFPSERLDPEYSPYSPEDHGLKKI